MPMVLAATVQRLSNGTSNMTSGDAGTVNHVLFNISLSS
jgi:hypothetical protein